MIVVVGFLLCIQLFIYLFPQFYISELGISFLPYWILLDILLLIYIGFFRKKRKRIGGVFLVSLLGMIYSYTFFQTYTHTSLGDMSDLSGDAPLSVLYANILKDNDQYTGLMRTIQTHDPDIILFVEFSEHHQEVLQPFLSDRYPYINRTTRSQKFVGSMVFSKYPISSVSLDFPRGVWRYGLFEVEHPLCQTQQCNDLYIYLVHTSSPISPLYYGMRNIQLERLVQDISTHNIQDKDVIVLGDFNVSPWSSHYKKMITSMPTFINSTLGSAIFTWKFHYLPFLWTHIDHVFVSGDITISDLQSLSIPGSDHRGFLFNISKNR